MLCRRCARCATNQPLLASICSGPLRLPPTSTATLATRLPPRPSSNVATRPAPDRRVFSSTPSAGPLRGPVVDAETTATALEKPDFLDEAESVIWDRLVAEFSPRQLVVQDVSGGCGSMYGIDISSEKFRGSTMLEQQRMVNAALADLMKGWHGVQLTTWVP